MPSSGIVTRILEHFWNHEYRHYYEGSIKRGANVFFSKNSGIPAAPAALRTVQNTICFSSPLSPSVKAQLRTLFDKKDRKNQGSTQLL